MARKGEQLLGDQLLAGGLITEEQLKQALEIQSQSGGFLGQVLVNLGLVSPRQVGQALQEKLGIPYLNLAEAAIDQEAAHCIPEEIARGSQLLPISQQDGVLQVAMTDPLNLAVIDDLKLLTGCRIVPLLTMEGELTQTLNRYFDIRHQAEQAIKEIETERETNDSEEPSAEQLLTMAVDAPVVRLVNSVIHGAFNQGASDIHLEPQSKEMRVRYRVDGLLYDQMTIPKGHQPAVISRIKIMARLNIAERRKPQDGRIALTHHHKQYDLRVASMPTIFGEKVVMRVLDKSMAQLPFERIGFLPREQEVFESLISQPYGMILVTGPTGSGKSTTLYAALNKINIPVRNVLTIEDPVEYQLPGVNQTQINPKAGVTFASGLRAMVRQDPDVIMVGEIRDLETAEIAIQAALTGHLVFSTLHTNDAPGAVIRLMDMGVEPFLIASSVIGVIGQRLARVVCQNCREDYQPDQELLESLGISPNGGGRPVRFARGTGCQECGGKGFRGRTAICELFRMTDRVRKLVLAQASSAQIKAAAVEQGMVPMREVGIRKVLTGVSTVDEVMRVVHSEEEDAIL